MNRSVLSLFTLLALGVGGGSACVQAPAKKVTVPVVLPAVVITGDHGVLVGKTLTLAAQTTDGEDTGYAWAVLDATVATVDANGVVTAVAAGETTVTATGAETGAIGRHALVVVESPAELPAEVTVTGAAFGVVEGQTATLTATTANGTDTGYTWASLDEKVATVADGVVTAVAVGETTITATGKETGAIGRHAIVVTPMNPNPAVPNLAAWAGSPHADKTAQAFKNWNGDDPPEIPTDCARCHSNSGFQDYIGEDGTAVGTVEKPAPVGSTVECQTCHNATTAKMTSVTFPSGVVVGGLGPEARCMTCHQGRASTDTVDAAIASAAAATDDTASDKLSFMNNHYYAAGATLYAGTVRGGYQYAGQTYDHRFRHVEGLDTCVGCHDPHSLQVRTDRCSECHQGFTKLEDAKNIRMMASLNQDYDGDGNTTEGIYYELDGLRNRLIAAIQTYTVTKALGAVCYNTLVFPYWFKDTDGDGTCSASEAAFPNRYLAWTPRMVRAAYNYHVSLKDPGAFAHNAKYIIQLLFDSVNDIATDLAKPELIGSSVRNDYGHFNGASEAARHWDKDEAVSATCARCHGGSEGFRFYLQYAVGTKVSEPDNGLDCATCHDNFGTTFDVARVASVTFPSGITLASSDTTTNLCSNCHAGREAKATIDQAIAQNKLGFKNVHYLPAAAIRQGAAAKVGYEYDGNSYASLSTTHPGGDQCMSCHSAKATNHSFRVEDNWAACKVCHQTANTLDDIRSQLKHGVDYDGNGSATSTLKSELDGIAAALLAQIQSVVTANGGAGICYNAGAYPYFFIDTNSNGVCDAGTELAGTNGFTAWTPALMKAAHNFQIAQKEPGAWAHNFDYVAQLLFDSIANLGGDTSHFIRP